MRAAAARRSAWAAAFISVAITVAGVWLGAGDSSASHSLLVELAVSIGLAFTLPTLGAFILTREPTNRLGWVFTATGLSRAVYVLAGVWVAPSYFGRPGSMPGGSLATWVVVNSLLPALILAPLTLLWAPNGRLPGRRWRWTYVTTAVATVAWLGTAVATWPYRGVRLIPAVPVADHLPSPIGDALVAVTLVASLLGLAGGVASLLWRLRGPDRPVVQQVKWYLLGTVGNIGLNLLGDIAFGGPSGWNLAGLLVFEAAVAVAVARHRLWDVDYLIRRTLVYGAVSALAAAVYAATVVSLGVVLGGVAHRQQAAVAGATLAAIALAAPARGGLQRLIDRAFDRRAFDAVAQVHKFAGRLGSNPPAPGELRTLLACVLGDPDLELAVGLADGVVVDPGGTPRSMVSESDRQVMTTWRGPAGITGFVLHRPPAEADAHLFAEVMRAASSSFEYARLQAELRMQLVAVEASRSRVVAAADAERHRIERNIHDGAQQRLVALAVHLRGDQRRLRAMLCPEALQVIDGTVEQLQVAVDELRALAQGLVPAALASEGLAPALVELVAHQAGAVRLLEVPPHRHTPQVEATAWFVACEGLTNAAKHAVGAGVTLTARCHDHSLTVIVSDNGPGGAGLENGSGLRGLADRVAAGGGTIHLESRQGRGTVLTVALPCA